MDNLPNKIRLYRRKAGLTQVELAQACGWDDAQGRVSNYESGSRTPALDDMRSMLSALNSAGVQCTLDELFPPQSAA